MVERQGPPFVILLRFAGGKRRRKGEEKKKERGRGGAVELEEIKKGRFRFKAGIWSKKTSHLRTYI